MDKQKGRPIHSPNTLAIQAKFLNINNDDKTAF